LGKKLSATCVTLYYHSIKRDDRQRFIEQMEVLKRLAQPISADMKDILTDGVHYVAVTFDDGFQNILKNALPELIERRIPATIFIPTGYIGREPDWIEDESHEDRHEVVMTEEEIKRLPKDLVPIGSHSVNHINLRLLGEDSLRRELIESKKKLQWLIGQDITLMSLPHGEYNERVVESALQAGYQRVFSSLPRLTGKKNCVVERVPVKASDWPLEFRLKILGAYRWLPFAMGLKRKVCSNMIRIFKK
jgi:peptidoglycan/xylan/chitin deacetylase (PgdA/CDA1 family)